LHEFLPQHDEEIAEVAEALGTSAKKLKYRVEELKEFNPMLGHRGCRLAITYPEITEMQARAIFEAAADAGEKTGKPVETEVMVPLIASREEFDFLSEKIIAVADMVQEEKGVKLNYSVGTMIELPRACLRAHEIAKGAEFFSFGTNDLTQTVYGLSRDDSASFLGDYTARGIFEVDPFVSIDRLGVGELVEIGVKRGRETRPDIKLGICGEHAGDPESIDFCEQVGLDYVSCSPFRLPVARLAAAQAVLRRKSAKS
jgi:pyruvate,orthophosphate dikinase